MRIKIEHKEIQTGFLFKKTFHEVHLTADFSHEEKQIIRQRGLTDDVLLQRLPPDAKPTDDPNWYVLKIGHLFERRPDRFRCRTPADAKAYEVELIGATHSLRAWLDANTETADTTVFEL